MSSPALLYPPTFVRMSDAEYGHAHIGVHEAGHAVYMETLGRATSVELFPTETGHSGRTHFNPAGCTSDELVRCALAGPAAELVWLRSLKPFGMADSTIQDLTSPDSLSGHDRSLLEASWPSCAYTDLRSLMADMTRFATEHWTDITHRAVQVFHTCRCDHTPPATAATDTTPASEPPAPTPHEGTAMSGIDEIRHALMTSSEKARYAQGALAQAGQDVEEIAQLLQQAAGSSSQPTVQEAAGTFARVRDELEQLRGLLHTGSEAVETYASQL